MGLPPVRVRLREMQVRFSDELDTLVEQFGRALEMARDDSHSGTTDHEDICRRFCTRPHDDLKPCAKCGSREALSSATFAVPIGVGEGIPALAYAKEVSVTATPTDANARRLSTPEPKPSIESEQEQDIMSFHPTESQRKTGSFADESDLEKEISRVLGEDLGTGPSRRFSLSALAPVGRARRASVCARAAVNTWLYAEDDDRGDVPREPTNCIERMVFSDVFESATGIVILLNCLTLGIEAHTLATTPLTGSAALAMDVGEYIFTFLFTIELLLRIRVYGLRSFLPIRLAYMWNFMDAVLVVLTGMIFGVIMPIVAKYTSYTDSGFVRTFQVLRVMRLLRLLRVVRKVGLFHEAWLLLRGLTHSMRTLFWTCVVIVFITYTFAVFGLMSLSAELLEIEKRTTDPAQLAELSELKEHVCGLSNLMYTLVQVLTLDSFHAFMRPLKKLVPWSWMYFYAYIAVVVFVLMNLVTAIIVENAVTNSKHEEEEALKAKDNQRERELEAIQNLFYLMDADGDGELTWEEFRGAFADPTMNKKWRMLDFRPEECREVFELLDDGDGAIETEEFFNGLRRIKGQAQSKDVLKVTKLVEKLRRDINHLTEGLGMRPASMSFGGTLTTRTGASA
eukprot:TRINITY_DN28459_c0_g1_i1.p1 TRINITY_DN28459_c0_g1~~TRINITY_DN28459_c0_g1_i1.p1  ORF type:complete len:624 (-),score=128.42 TRINITY_DN28459_c0_g1_i1:49-1920(-)